MKESSRKEMVVRNYRIIWNITVQRRRNQIKKQEKKTKKRNLCETFNELEIQNK